MDSPHLGLARENLIMSDWLHNLPILWMTLVVFGFTCLLTAGIYGLVTVLAKGERARAFKAISPGLLSPLAIIFGLFVAFTAAQVWTDNDRANAAVDREANALRAVVVLAAAFPGEPEMAVASPRPPPHRASHNTGMAHDGQRHRNLAVYTTLT